MFYKYIRLTCKHGCIIFIKWTRIPANCIQARIRILNRSICSCPFTRPMLWPLMFICFTSLESNHLLLNNHFSGIFSLYSFSRLSIIPLHLASLGPFQTLPMSKLSLNPTSCWQSRRFSGERQRVSEPCRPALSLRMLVVSFPQAGGGGQWQALAQASPGATRLHLPAEAPSLHRQNPHSLSSPDSDLVSGTALYLPVAKGFTFWVGELFAKFSFSDISWCYGHHRWDTRQHRVPDTFDNHFSMWWFKSYCQMGPKFQDQPKSAFDSVI